MSYTGRITAGTIAIGTILFTAGFGYWSSDANSLYGVTVGVAAYAITVLLIAWFLGSKYDQLKDSLTIDYLTGLYNRGFIEASFPKLAKQAQSKRKKMSVFMLDVNDFKEVNDRFGHIQGDKALKLISDALSNCSTRGEIAGRWGGDEFIMICPYAEDKMIERMMRQLQEELLKLSMMTGIRLSVSIGSASFPDMGSELSGLVLAADKRMYADKCSRKMRASESEAMQA